MEKLFPVTELLVLRAQAGEREAFATLAELWQPLLRAHSRRLTRGFGPSAEQWAEDATQEAWLAVARGLARLEDPRAFGAWAMRIVARRVADRARRAARKPRTGVSDPPQNGPGTDDDARRSAERDEGLARMRVALATLPDADRLLLIAAYRQDMGVAELAAWIGAPVGTVKSRMHRARRKLRDAMERMHQNDYARP